MKTTRVRNTTCLDMIFFLARLKKSSILRRVLRRPVVLRRCFRGGGYFCMATAAGDTREEVVGDRGVLSKSFPGAGGGEEEQEKSMRPQAGSAENEVARDRAAESESRAERLGEHPLVFFSFPSYHWTRSNFSNERQVQAVSEETNVRLASNFATVYSREMPVILILTIRNNRIRCSMWK